MLEPVPIIGMYFLGFAVVWLGILAGCCVAGIIGRLAYARASEALDPALVRPLYVRRPAVELARDEKLRHNQLSDNGH